MNRFGGDDISGPGAVPQSGANPDIRTRPIFQRPAMGVTAIDKAVSIAGHHKSMSLYTRVSIPYGMLTRHFFALFRFDNC